MKKFLIAAVVGGFALVGFAPVASAVTEHCPDGGVKVEANGGTQAAINDLVLDAGVRVCVKGSTDATGIVIADGETSLEDILDNGHDVSYYVIYPPLPVLVSAFVCFEGEIVVFTDDDQTSLNLQVSAFLEISAGAVQVESREAVCEVPEEPELPVTPAPQPPVVEPPVETPPVLASTPAPGVPVLVSTPAPGVPVAVSELPRTGTTALWLGGLGLLVLALGVGLRTLFRPTS